MAQETTTRMTIETPRRHEAQSLLRTWSQRPGVRLTVVRGRISADWARFELEIRGAADQVARIVRQSVPWVAAPLCVAACHP